MIIDQGQGQPRFLDERFDAAGNAVRCSGNTIIAHLQGETQRVVADVQANLAQAPGGTNFAWLPVSSLHMTIYDLLLHDRREGGHWPDGLPAGASEPEADAFALERLRGFDTGIAGPISMSVTELEIGDYGASITLEPADAAAGDLVGKLRGRIAERVGLSNRPGHDTYVFHITLAYLIAWFTADQAAAFEEHRKDGEARLKAALGRFDLWPPEVCLFDDMCAFRTQFTLG